MKEKVQSFGRFLSGMVMPNLGAFIAWGLITALFIPTGWLPNETFSALVGPMIVYLLYETQYNYNYHFPKFFSITITCTKGYPKKQH